METKTIKAGRGDRIFNITVTAISIIMLVIALYPLYFVIIASISSPEDISLGKVVFLPSGINFYADVYKRQPTAVSTALRPTGYPGCLMTKHVMCFENS